MSDFKNLNVDFTLLSVFDAITDKLRSILTEEFFVSNERWLLKMGYLSGLVFSAHVLIVSTWGAIKTDSFAAFGVGIGVALATLVLLYISLKLMPACLALIENSPSSVANRSFLDIMGLLFTVLGCSIFIFLAYLAVKESSSTLFFIGLGVFFSFCYGATLFFTPKLISITVSEKTSAALEGISVFSSFIKVTARVVIINFGSWLLIGEISLILDTLNALTSEDEGIISLMISATSHIGLIGAGLLVAIFTYFSFIFSMLSIQIAEAILIIPDRFLGLSKVLALTAKLNSKPQNHVP